jgi:hypothetical protein
MPAFPLDCSREDQLSLWTVQERISFLSVLFRRGPAFPLDCSGEDQLSLWTVQERISFHSGLFRTGQRRTDLF